MEKLTEAVINLINEDVIKGKKIIENELYVRLGKMLEEKLLDYAPGIFSEGSKPDFLDLDGDGNTKEPMKGAARSNKKKKKMEESFSSEEDLITEDYEVLLEEVQQIVEEIEAETGEELSESEIEEIADLVLESYESDPDEDEDQDDDEDYDDEE